MCEKLIKSKKRQNAYEGDNEISNKYMKGYLWHDKIETTKEYLECVDEVDQLASIEASKTGHGKGYCHKFWKYKKQLLKEKYNIDWRTPQEMNPDCRFD